MIRYFISYPKSGRTWLRYALMSMDAAQDVRFHHDGFEFNDGSKPPLDFSIEKRLNKYGADDKIVYLERDPRDVMVSLYYQVKGRFSDFFSYQGGISDFIRDDYFGAVNLARFRAMWSDIIKQRPVLKIRYEDCHKDLSGVIKEILDYYHFQPSPAKIEQAIRMASFESMKSLEDQGNFPHAWLRPRNGAPKVRRGKAGGFDDELCESDIAYLNQVFELKE